MSQINWEAADLDDHPKYAARIAREVVNFADCIEVFLPHEEAKSDSDPRSNVPDATFGPHTAYNAAVSVEQLINPMQEQHGCLTGSLSVFAPLWAIRQELWRLYEMQGWHDIPTIQLPAGVDTAISSTRFPSSYISGMSLRFRILARLLVHASKNSPLSPAPDKERVPPKALDAMARATQEGSLEQRAIAILVIHPDWSKARIAKKLKCHPKSLAKGRAPRLDDAIKAYKTRAPPSRGTKAPDGTVEAWEDTPEDW